MSQAVSLTSRARIPEGILFHVLQDELVVLNLNNGIYFGLDPVGTRIWQLIQGFPSHPLQRVVQALTEEYEVEEERCAQDLLHLVSCLQENTLLEVSN